MIKAIIFDYFGVITSDNFWQNIGDDVNEAGNFHQLVDEVNSGALSWQAYIEDMARELHKTPQAVLALYKQERINLDVLDYIKQLHGQFKTALLTNASYEFLKPVIKSMKLDRLFDAIVISSRLGIIKPNPDILDYTLNQLKIDRSEAIFIDDSSFNIAAARQLGIKSILYNSFDQLQSELESLV